MGQGHTFDTAKMLGFWAINAFNLLEALIKEVFIFMDEFSMRKYSLRLWVYRPLQQLGQTSVKFAFELGTEWTSSWTFQYNLCIKQNLHPWFSNFNGCHNYVSILISTSVNNNKITWTNRIIPFIISSTISLMNEIPHLKLNETKYCWSCSVWKWV